MKRNDIAIKIAVTISLVFLFWCFMSFIDVNIHNQYPGGEPSFWNLFRFLSTKY